MVPRPHVDCFHSDVSNSGDVVTSKGLLQQPFGPGEFNIRNYGWVDDLGSKQDRRVVVILVEKGLAPRKPGHWAKVKQHILECFRCKLEKGVLRLAERAAVSLVS